MRLFSTLKFALPLVAATATMAVAQTAPPNLVQTRAQFIAYSGMLAPGLANGELINANAAAGNNPNPPSPFDNPIIDNTGYVVFRSKITGGTVITQTERAVFGGRGTADLQLLARGGQQAPGLASGILMQAASLTNGNSIAGSPRISSTNGYMMFSAVLNDPSGLLGVTTLNDSMIFGGVAGNLIPFAREGDPAPGTVGATFGSVSGLSQQPTACNENGVILFQAATLGGDTITSGTAANNAAWFTGQPGNLQIMQRKGDAVTLPTGTGIISALGFISQMNNQNQVLHDETLSTTVGTPAATTANDKTLWIYTPGVGNTLILREGDPAPGTGGGTFNIASNSWSINTGSNTFNANGNTVMNADIMGGNVVPGVSDRAIYWGGVAGWTQVMRRGDAAPGIGGATFNVVSNASLNLNNNELVAFEATVTGGTVTSTNDSGIWVGYPGNLVQVMREGDPAPGTVGAVFDDIMGRFMIMNERGQIIFSASLTGGDVNFTTGNSTATYCWDPVVGLQLVARVGDMLTLPDNTTRQINSFGSGIQFNNGAANPLSMNSLGEICSHVNFTTATGGGGAIVKLRIGSFAGFPHDISASAGGTHTMFLDAGPANAGNVYVVMGSITGSTPGFQYNQFLVPLNQDYYFQLTITLPNVPPLINTLNNLDVDGRSVSAFVMPPNLPQLAGFVFNHAAAVVNPNNGQVTLISDAQEFVLVP